MSKTLIIHAEWDPDAHVWVASSSDVPGLATEAASPKELSAKLKYMIPELLNANSSPHSDTEVKFCVFSPTPPLERIKAVPN